MDLLTVENILKARGVEYWEIKGEHFCYTNGDTRFLFDKIDNSFLGFRKLTLVSDGRLVQIPFFKRKGLLSLVKKKRELFFSKKKHEAMATLISRRRAPAPPPPPPPPRRIPSTIPVAEGLSLDEAVERWSQFGQAAGDLSMERLHALLGNRPSRPAIPDEGKLPMKSNKSKERVEKTLDEAELRSKQFQENVEIEKARIREILRKKKK